MIQKEALSKKDNYYSLLEKKYLKIKKIYSNIIYIMQYSINQEEDYEKLSITLPSPSFDREEDEEKQIFKDILITEQLDEASDEDEKIINEMLEYELDQQNDNVEKIVLKDVIIILNPQDVVIKKKRNYTVTSSIFLKSVIRN